MKLTSVKIKDDDEILLKQHNIGYSEAIRLFCEMKRQNLNSYDLALVENNIKEKEQRLEKLSSLNEKILARLSAAISEEKLTEFLNTL